MVTRVSTMGTLVAGGWQRVATPLHWPAVPPAAGDVVQLAQCSGGVNQQFELDGAAKTVVARGAGGEALCLDSCCAKTSAGAPLVLKKCTPGAKTQSFAFGAAGRLAGHLVAGGDPAGARGCVDVGG